MRFVHTADWQLGMTRRILGARPPKEAGGLTGEAQARFAEARLRLDAVLQRLPAEPSHAPVASPTPPAAPSGGAFAAASR